MPELGAISGHMKEAQPGIEPDRQYSHVVDQADNGHRRHDQVQRRTKAGEKGLLEVD